MHGLDTSHYLFLLMFCTLHYYILQITMGKNRRIHTKFITTTSRSLSEGLQANKLSVIGLNVHTYSFSCVEAQGGGASRGHCLDVDFSLLRVPSIPWTTHQTHRFGRHVYKRLFISVFESLQSELECQLPIVFKFELERSFGFFRISRDAHAGLSTPPSNSSTSSLFLFFK